MMNSVRYFLMCEELVRLPVVVASLIRYAAPTNGRNRHRDERRGITRLSGAVSVLPLTTVMVPQSVEPSRNSVHRLPTR